MSETIQNKLFTIKKTKPGTVMFKLSPLSQPQISRIIELTDRIPQQTLPLDWCLGIFINQSNFNMYKKGYFTFTDNQAALQAVKNAGMFFDDMELDFKPAEKDITPEILLILKRGVRTEIMSSIEKYGKADIEKVATMHYAELSTSVVTLLENLLHIQLTMDGGE